VTTRRWLSRLAALARGRRLDADLDDEIRAHLELAERDARARGLTADEARRLARLQFGCVERVREQHRDVRRPRAIDAFGRDLRFAARRLRARPGFAGAAALTLALGAGLATVAFTTTRALIHGPMGVADPDRLVWIGTRVPAAEGIGGGVSGVEADSVASQTDVFAAVAVIGSRARVLTVGQGRAEWTGLWVTLQLADVLRITPAAGRAFTGADLDHRGAAPAMMMGFSRWQRDFGGDPAIVGRVLRFEDNKPHTIVGVLPRGLRFPDGRAPGAGSGVEFALGEQDFWILGQELPSALPGGTVVARLRDGMAAEAAAARVEAIAADARDPDRIATAVTIRSHALGAMRRGVPLLSAFAALVLAIACANLTTMMLARGSQAHEEATLRLALGADRVDLVRLMVAEALWIALAGAAGAVGFTAAARALFAAAIDAAVVERATSLGMTAAFALLTATLVALAATAVRVSAEAWRIRPSAIRVVNRGASADRRVTRAMNGFVCAQIAITLVLLTGGALVVRSLGRLLAVDAGYDRRGVVAADVLMFGPPAEFVPYFLNLHERLRALPGVEAVGLVQSTPLTGKWIIREPLGLDGRGSIDASGTFVAFDYFEAIGTPVLDGRTFTRDEVTSSRSRVIVINDVAAAHFFPGERAVGRRLTLLGRPREVVGVVKGTRDVELSVAAEAQWYQPAFVGGSQVIVRTSDDAAAFVDTIRRELLASDARVIVKRVEPLASVVARSVGDRRTAAQLLAGAAAVATVLALVGLYGVVNFRSLQRRREFSVRVALGASPRTLMMLVLRQAAAISMLGVSIGAAAAVPLSRSLESLLFSVRAGDPSTTAVVALALAAMTIATSAIPACRAARVNPVDLLR
jgi:predicted permease